VQTPAAACLLFPILSLSVLLTVGLIVSVFVGGKGKSYLVQWQKKINRKHLYTILMKSGRISISSSVLITNVCV
jgi:ABC-type Fe3+ transport system permease subunit